MFRKGGFLKNKVTGLFYERAALRGDISFFVRSLDRPVALLLSREKITTKANFSEDKPVIGPRRNVEVMHKTPFKLCLRLGSRAAI